MRKTFLLLASLALAVLLVSGVAWAAKIHCKPGSTYNHPCHGTKSPDILRGTSGRDYIIGYPKTWQSGLFPRDNETIYGFAGRDWLDGGGGRDKLYGGPSNDSIGGGYEKVTDKLYGQTGNDAINGRPRDQIFGGDGDDFLTGSGPGSQPGFWGSGGAGNDQVYGGLSHDTLAGASGADYVNGYLGNDLIHGGAGADVLRGHLGEDHLYGDDGDDTIDADDVQPPNDYPTRDFVYCGAGFDTVWDVDSLDVIAEDCENIIPDPNPDSSLD